MRSHLGECAFKVGHKCVAKIIPSDAQTKFTGETKILRSKGNEIKQLKIKVEVIANLQLGRAHLISWHGNEMA